MYDVIIIGAGCAGLTASIYAARAGKKVLVIEAETVGGQISSSPRVENFPGFSEISGLEFSDRLFEQSSALGVELELATVEKIEDGEIKTVFTDYGEFKAPRIIIASGVKHRTLGIKDEQRFSGRGVSYCAVCDGAFYTNKRVAVVGGGSTALQSAELLSATSETVFLVHRRDSFRGEEAIVERLRKKSNVEFVLDSVVKGLEGEDKLSGIAVENTKTGVIEHIRVQGLFVAVGQIPNNSAFEGAVELDESGFIRANEDCRTSAQGIFAAGDCRTKSVRQLTTAAADGTVAALGAVAAL